MTGTRHAPTLPLVLSAGIVAAVFLSGMVPNLVSVTFAQGHSVGNERPGPTGSSPAVGAAPVVHPLHTEPADSIPVGPYPTGVAYDSANGYVYVANSNDNVTVINGATNTVVGSLTVGSLPWGIAVDRSSGFLYVTNANSNNVTVINGTNDKVVVSVHVGVDPSGVAYDSSNGYVYVANWVEPNGNVTVINGTTDTVVGSIPAGSGPDTIAYDPSNRYVYVANDLSDNVTVINGGNDTVQGSVPVGSEPRAVVYDGANGLVYVANYGGDNMTVINGTTDTVVGSVPAGAWPDAAAYDSTNGYVYVVDYLSDNVTVINGTTDASAGSVAVGTDPDGAAYDAANEDVYVANYISDTVTVIPTRVQPYSSPYPVTFSQTGLPEGTIWSVTVGLTTNSSTAPASIVFTEPNATYPYAVEAVLGYVTESSSGSVIVAGAPVTVTVNFTTSPPPVFSVFFTETGLPSGTSWGVVAGPFSANSTGETVFFVMPNGTYPYTIGTVAGYTASPSSGNLTVNWGPASTSVQFRPVPSSSTSSTFLGLSTGYLLVGGILGAGAVMAVIVAMIAVSSRKQKTAEGLPPTLPPASPPPGSPPPIW